MQTQQSNIEYILPSSTLTARGKGHWIGNTHTVNPPILWRRGARDWEEMKTLHTALREIIFWGSGRRNLPHKQMESSRLTHLEWNTVMKIQRSPFPPTFPGIFKDILKFLEMLLFKRATLSRGSWETFTLANFSGNAQCLSKILGKWSKFLEWKRGCSFHFVQSKG